MNSEPTLLNVKERQSVRYCIPAPLKFEQIKINLRKNCGRIEAVTELRKEPIACVSFGPSLKDTWEKIKEFKYVMSCSGSHKFLVEHGIIPTHHIDVDPREHKIKLIGEPQKGCEYLIASTCHPKLIDYLQNAGCTVKLWHIFDSEEEGYRILPPGEWMVTGGCSVGTRTMTLARFIGFTEQHIFGMDGSFPSDGNSHAGEHPNDASRKPPYETEYNGVKYRTTPAMLEAARNAWHELDMLKDVKPTFYGEGLVQTMAKDWKRKELPEKAQVFIAFDKPELISAGYCEQNRKLHQENPLYGIGGARHAKTVMQLCKAMESTSVLDYGCQPPDARVLTPTGWRKIGDIQKGDLVIGSDGCPTKVLGVHRPGIAQIYRVSFNDGASLLVDGGHLWAVRTSNHQKRGQPFTLRQTRDLASEKLRWNNPNHPDSKPLKWRIPMVKPVQFEGQKLPFHPYIMGVLLGDGCLCMSLPTFVTATPGLAEEVAALLPPTVALSPYRERKNGLKVFGIAKKSRRFGRGEQRKNPISDALLALGLSGARAWTKFIPNIYLFAKESERFALLQGLLDTDGEVRQKHTSYCTTSEELAHNVVFLSQSLGFNARIATKVPTYQGGKKGRLAYIVHIKPSDGAKVARVKSAGRRVEYHANRLIENIDAAGQSEVVGIEVEAEDGLYVTEHCIVTHNCGKGQLARELPFAIWEYDPAIPDKQASPRPADLCVATDVLEHIEPEKLHFVLEDLRRCTLRVGYFVIHTRQSSKVLPDGRNTHLIQRGRIWWKKTLKKYFALVKDSIIEKPPLLYCVVAKKTK
jgi:hypothetical protein